MKKIKRIVAFLIAVIILVGMMPLSTFAASGNLDMTYLTQYAYTFSSAYPAPFGGVSRASAGRMSVNGTTAYCIEFGVLASNGTSYSSSDYWDGLTGEAKALVNWALCYGFTGGAKYGGTNDQEYWATAVLIWQIAAGTVNTDWEEPINNVFFASDSTARSIYYQIKEKVYSFRTIPSFTSSINDSSITPVHEMTYNSSTGLYEVTLTDTRNVLDQFNFSASGYTMTRSGNTLKITTANPQELLTVSRAKNLPSDVAGYIEFWSAGGGHQHLISYVRNGTMDDPVIAYFRLKISYGSAKIVKTSEDGKVSGIQFTITGNGVNKTVTTGANGEIQVDNLPAGEYTVTEQSIDKYEPQTSKTVTVRSGQTATVSFSNTMKRGSLSVTKTSEDGLVSGVKFRLYGTSLSGDTVDVTATTNSNGVATFSNILISGSTPYILEEVDTAIRYVVPAGQNVSINWNAVTNASVSNILKKWRVTVTKSDVETGAAQGDAKLSGAVYGIYKGDELIDTYTTDASGKFTTSYYPCGDNWTVREITPSEGYLLDSTVHSIGASAGNFTVERNTVTNAVTERIIKGNLSIIKHSNDGETQIETPEAGAVFEVFLKSAGGYAAAKDSERDILTCDEHGFAESKQLPYGIYTVRQTSGWDGRELMPDFDVYIAKDGNAYRYLINNANFRSYLKIVKVDAETGNTIPYAGAGFQIYNPDGSLVTMTYTYPEVVTIDTFYTSENGYLITPEKLEYGSGYSIVEVQAPFGYVLNPDPVTFDVTPDDSGEDGGVTVVEVTKTNLAQKGIVHIAKTGEVFATVTEADGIYQPVFHVKGLPGAVYEITAAEDIYTLDGTLRAPEGKVVDTVTTDGDGKASSVELYLGKYAVTEITAPDGMVLNDEVHEVELTYAGQEISVTETATSFYNERQHVEVGLQKTLEQDSDFGVGMNGEIFDVTFGIYAAEELTAADGTTVPADGLIEIVSLDADGNGVCATDLPFGSFYLKELSTNERYILSDTKYPVAFEYAGQDTAIVEITANGGEAIANKMIRGRVAGIKTDTEGNPLSGAVIGLFKETETVFTERTALYAVVTGETGAFSFRGVPYGEYVVREIASPEGYVLTDELFPVNIAEHGTFIEILMENKQIKGSIRLIKVDADNNEVTLPDAVFELYTSDDELVGEYTTDEYGEIFIAELVYNDYYWIEKGAPEKYLLDSAQHEFSIVKHNVPVELTVKNVAMTGTAKLLKVNDSGTKLKGAVFQLFTADNNLVGEYITDDNGEIVVSGLRLNSYYWQEKTAPSGYELNTVQHGFQIDNDGQIVEITVVNQIPDIPQTGDDSNITGWIIACALGCIGFALSLFFTIRLIVKQKCIDRHGSYIRRHRKPKTKPRTKTLDDFLKDETRKGL